MTGTPPGTLGPCRALTYEGTPCRRSANHEVTINGTAAALCGTHAHRALTDAVGLWGPDDPPPAAARTRSSWTVEHDAYVAAHLVDPAMDVARHLGRTVSSVQQRRRLLRRIAREGRP